MTVKPDVIRLNEANNLQRSANPSYAPNVAPDHIQQPGGQDLGISTNIPFALDAGYDLERQLTQDDLVRGDDCFFSATGVTDGDVLQGVRYEGRGVASTESIVMRASSGTVRRVTARHNREKMREMTG